MAIPSALASTQSSGGLGSQPHRTSSRAVRSRPSSSHTPSSQTALPQKNTSQEVTEPTMTSQNTPRLAGTLSSRRTPSSSSQPSTRRVVSASVENNDAPDRSAVQSMTTSQSFTPFSGYSSAGAPPKAGPRSTSRSSSGQSANITPRLGDTLLRKVSPVPHSTGSTNSLAGSQSGASSSRLALGKSQHSLTTHAVRAANASTPSSPKAHPYAYSPSLSSANASADANQSVSMGPPKARASAARTSSSGGPASESHTSGSANSTKQSSSRRLSSSTGATSSKRDGNSKIAPPPVPTLPNLDTSLHSPLFGDEPEEQNLYDESIGSLPSFSALSPQQKQAASSEKSLRQTPSVNSSSSTQAAAGRTTVGALSSRRPDLRLTLNAPEETPQQPGSRFSAFSSALPTPDVHEGSIKGLSSSRSTTYASLTPSQSSSGLNTPARELSSNAAGLGLGLPSSFEASQHLSPQTPQRGSRSSPKPSPSEYDRRGQIGLGELSTPRWNNFGNGKQTVAAARPSTGSTATEATQNAGAPRDKGRNFPSTTPVKSQPAYGSLNSKQRDATVQRHSRAISLTSTGAPVLAQRNTSGPTSSLVTSPSMPTHNLAGYSSISSLARDFDNEPIDHSRDLQQTTTPGQSLHSPQFSISAMSESDTSMAHGGDDLAGLKTAIARSRSKEHILGSPSNQTTTMRGSSSLQPSTSWTSATSTSPRIGDLAWSGAETGPFGVPTEGDEDIRGSRSTATASNVDPYGISEAEYRGSFDLNTAIADLLKDDEERRQRRRDLGVESDTDSPRSSADVRRLSKAGIDNQEAISRRVSGLQRPLSSSRASSVAFTSPLRKTTELPNFTEAVSQQQPAKRVAGSGSTDVGLSRTSQRTRHSSSPGQVLSGAQASTKNVSHPPPLPTGVGTTSTSGAANTTGSPYSSRSSKRVSSASVGHSLLRSGTLPFNPSTDDSQEAAEALRKLDGIGQRRRSSSKERPSAESGSGKSPRASRSYSRPNSAGRAASRPSSPSGTTRSQGSDATRLRSSEESKNRRTSRNLSRPKVDDAGGVSPKVSLDSPTSAAFSSPRMRKGNLPPLPTQSGMAALSSPLISASSVSKRTSAVSVASRESIPAKEPSQAPITATSRQSSASKSKRVSDASSHLSHNLDTPRSDSFEDDEHRNPGPTHGQSLQSGPRGGQSTSLVIPPVPPLPKAWESTRSGSHSNLSIADGIEKDDAASFLSANTTQTLVTPGATQSMTAANDLAAILSPRVEQTSNNDLGGQTARRKWSLTNLSANLGRSPSEAKKRTDDAPPSTPPVSYHFRQAPRPSNETAISTSATDARKTPHMDESLADTSALTTSTRVSKDPVSPSVSRRTPSFLRRKGQDGTVDSIAGSSSSGTQVSKTPPPAAGRSSRKSILGLGSLLRSSTSRKSVQLTSRDEPSGHSAGSSHMPSEFGVKTEDSTVSSSSSSSSLKSLRRSSLIGRKRGKTLPSSTDPPAVVPATLPPIQVTPFKGSPQVRAPTDTNALDVPPNRRRLANSNSVGDLQAKSTQNKASGEPTTPSMRRVGAGTSTMPTIQDSSPAEGQQAHLFPPTSSSRAEESSSIASIAPASRIPRATGSIRRTPLRSGAGNANAASSDATGGISASSSFSTRRLSSYGNSALPHLSKSSTMANLASNFGINGSENSASDLAAPRDANADIVDPRLKSTVASAKSSPVSDGHQQSSSTSEKVSGDRISSSVQSIINAFNAAKTSSESEGAIRRARITAYSSNLSNAEREALNALIARHDQTTKAGATSSVHGVQEKPSAAESTAATARATRRLSSSANLQKDTASQSSSASATASLPRRVRTSVTAASATARTAREQALTTAKDPRKTISRSSETRTASGQESRSVSAASTLLDEEERAGDEEMEAYIRRSHAKKLAQGVSQAELDKMLCFPEPEAPSKAYSPRQAEALYGNQLSDYELTEMFDYKQIFYVGNARAKVMATGDKTANNHGYDDERGDYNVVERDHLAYRYEIVGTLGRGSFGQVLQCKDHKTGRSVAIKLIRNKKRFHHQALVEVKILQNLVQWDPEEQYNVIKMTDSFYFRNHLCISMELLSINLYELIKANSFAGFSTALIRRFSSQVLLSLSLMRHHRVVHCDLKPENILLKHPRKSAIKVIDFGSSCFEHEKVYTYIQSRFYRSPEVILGMNYHTAIDIWSLGCILAELFTGYPLFPGENEQEQLSCIMEILGVPDRYLVDRASRKKLFFDSTGNPRPYVSAKGKRRRPATRTLGQALKCNDELFLDFLAKCLIWDPERRIKPEAALRHAWIRSAGAGTNNPTLGSLEGGSSRGRSPHVRQPSLSLRGGLGVGAGIGPATSSSSLSSSSGPTTAASTNATSRTARASLLTSSTSGPRSTAGTSVGTGTGSGASQSSTAGASNAGSNPASTRRTSMHGGSAVSTLRRTQQQPVS